MLPRVPRPNDRMGRPSTDFSRTTLPGLICIRRDLHSNPEVGWHEHRTSAVVASLLDEVGLTPAIRQGTALVYDIHVGEPSEGDDIATVALRALTAAPRPFRTRSRLTTDLAIRASLTPVGTMPIRPSSSESPRHLSSSVPVSRPGGTSHLSAGPKKSFPAEPSRFAPSE